MSLDILEAADGLKVILPAFGAAMLLSLVMLIAIRLSVRNIWIKDRRFKWLGIFYRLDGQSALCLACAWLMLVEAIAYVFLPSVITIPQCIFYGVPALVLVFCTRPLSGLPGRLLWVLIQFAGIGAVNLIKGYITETHLTRQLELIYLFITIVISLFSVYLFFLELVWISEKRDKSTLTEGLKGADTTEETGEETA